MTFAPPGHERRGLAVQRVTIDAKTARTRPPRGGATERAPSTGRQTHHFDRLARACRGRTGDDVYLRDQERLTARFGSSHISVIDGQRRRCTSLTALCNPSGTRTTVRRRVPDTAVRPGAAAVPSQCWRGVTTRQCCGAAGGHVTARSVARNSSAQLSSAAIPALNVVTCKDPRSLVRRAFRGDQSRRASRREPISRSSPVDLREVIFDRQTADGAGKIVGGTRRGGATRRACARRPVVSGPYRAPRRAC
jgi:hypothetical protein